MATRLGIELLPHACRIVAVSSPPRLFGGSAPGNPRVRQFREVPYSPSDLDAFVAELRKALKGLPRRASLAVWGLHSSHQAFLLPPAAPADLEAVARRESRVAAAALPAPPLADVVVAGALRENRRETGYAAVSADDLRARLQPLRDAGVTPDSVTTPALAHASLVRQRTTPLPDAVVAVLSVNATATAVTVVRGGVVLFARELPWGGEPDTRDDEAGRARRVLFASRVAAELRRSLIYVRQNRGVDVSRLLVCGDLPDLRSLTGPLVNELGLDVETLDVGDDLDLSTLPEPAEDFRSRLGAWKTAAAIAADAAGKSGLVSHDVRPAALTPALARRIATAALAGALVAAGAWGVFGYLSAGVAARQERLRRTIAVLEPALQRHEDERQRAAVAAAREAALSALASQGPRLARILESFGLAAPAGLALSAIRVEPGTASWRLIVEGQAEGADAAAAHATFNAFLKALEASPLLGRPAEPPGLQARTADPAEAEAPRAADAPPEETAEPARPVATPRPAATGPAYIEVARDGRLYRIPLRRNTGNIEAARNAEETRRLQDAALARRASAAPSVAIAASPAGRQPASVVEFTLRYEVPK